MTSKFVGPYFKIAKVIKIFDNKIDEHDLLNYAITGKIELSVFIPEFKTLIWCPCLTKDMRDWLLNTGISGHRITLGSSSIEKDIGFFELHYDNNSNPDGAEWVRGLDTNIGNQCLFPGIAGGVWRIPPASALELLKNDSVQIPVGELLQADYFDSIYELFDPKKMVKINPNHKISSIEVNINKIIITKKQMYKLDELLNPAPLIENTTQEDKNEKIKKRHELRRELILASALHALHKNREECGKNATGLFNYLNDHAAYYGLPQKEGALTEHTKKIISRVLNQDPEEWKLSKDD
ncbi:TPA: hypothetical protein ACSUNC_002476 [Salmonella enterica subsp. diarizonae]